MPQARLLDAILTTLIEEWGYARVKAQLDVLHESNELPSHGGKSGRGLTGRKSTSKPNAVSMAAKVDSPAERKHLLSVLADRYDKKLFLPTAGDIRFFFEVHGEITPPIKQRHEAFRRVLKLLSSLEEDALRRMIDDHAHSGPSKLAPLSEAMRGAGESRQTDRKLEEATNQGNMQNDATKRVGQSDA